MNEDKHFPHMLPGYPDLQFTRWDAFGLVLCVCLIGYAVWSLAG